MADGIQQAGAGATITFQNDTNADADLDGDLDRYSPADIVAKALVSGDAIDLGTLTKYYRFRASIQGGDGSGTAATTFRFSNGALAFDSGKTFLSAVAGTTARQWLLGDKIQGVYGKPSGVRGTRIDMAAAATFRGKVLAYGTHLRNGGTGAIAIVPGGASVGGEVVNCLLETTTGTANIALGIAGQELDLIYNVDCMVGGTGTVSSLAAAQVERFTVAVLGTNQYFINTGAILAMKDGVFIGTPTIADFRSTAGAPGSYLINHTWSGNAPKWDVSVLNAKEALTLNMRVVNPYTGSPVSGIPVMLKDKYGTVIFLAYTDALGQISFNNDGALRAIFQNAIVVTELIAGVEDVKGPFTLRTNLDGTTVPGFPPQQFLFDWPYVNLPSSYGKQYMDISDLNPLRVPSAPGWTELIQDLSYA